jgi:tRNA(fMet)-specific endonuclease VapC
MKILLDTSAYSQLKRGSAEVAGLVRQSTRVYLSAIVIGELLYGFRNGTRLERNLVELESFLESPFVTFLPVSYETADRFSRIAAALKQSGTPIPTNDMWIAAHALEVGADLITLDSHFEAIDAVTVHKIRIEKGR